MKLKIGDQLIGKKQRERLNEDITSRNLKKNIKGVVIVGITNRSPLANLLSVNDIIIEVQKTPVKNSADLNKMSKQAIETTRNNFNAEIMSKRFVSLISEMSNEDK